MLPKKVAQEPNIIVNNFCLVFFISQITFKCFQVYAIPCSSASSERAFSQSGKICTKGRARLNPKTTEALSVIKLNRQAVIDFKEKHKVNLDKKVAEDSFKLVEIRVETPTYDENSNFLDRLDDNLVDKILSDSEDLSREEIDRTTEDDDDIELV